MNRYHLYFGRIARLTALMWLIVYPCLAQKKFSAGYIVDARGDTLKGLVDGSSPKRNLHRCLFKQSEKDDVKTYQAGEIRAFGFSAGGHYESFPQASGQVFAELLVTGHATLLHDGDLFYVRKDSKIFRLTKPYEQIIKTGEATYSKTVRPYIDTLRIAMSDCPTMDKLVKAASYTHVSFYKLVRKYNACTGTVVQEFDTRPWLSIHFRAGAGATRTALKLNPGYFPLLGDGGFDNTTRLSAGVGLTLSSPRVLSNLKLVADVWWLKNSMHGRTNNIGSVAYHYEYFVDVTSLKIPIGFRYHFSNHGFSPFVGAGYTTELFLKASNYGTKDTEAAHVVTTDGDFKVYTLRNTVAGFWFSAGVTRKITDRMSVWGELRMENTNGYFGPGVSNLSSTNVFSLLAGFQF